MQHTDIEREAFRQRLASASLQEALQLSDDTLDSITRLTAAHYADGKVESALALCRGLVHLRPRDARGWTALGAILVRLDRHDEALPALDEALRLDPDDIAALVNRAECHLAAADNRRAAVDLDRAIELDPGQRDLAANRARQIAFAMYAVFEQCRLEGLDTAQVS